jgi:hypothetical protein
VSDAEIAPVFLGVNSVIVRSFKVKEGQAAEMMELNHEKRKWPTG